MQNIYFFSLITDFFQNQFFFRNSLLIVSRILLQYFLFTVLSTLRQTGDFIVAIATAQVVICAAALHAGVVVVAFCRQRNGLRREM